MLEKQTVCSDSGADTFVSIWRRASKRWNSYESKVSEKMKERQRRKEIGDGILPIAISKN